MKAHFRPEFLNRLDEILPFLPLRREDMEKIVKIQLNHIVNRLLEKQIELIFTRDVVLYLAKEGYDPLFGARPLKRLIQTKIVNMLANEILEGQLVAGNKIQLILDGETVHYKKF